MHPCSKLRHEAPCLQRSGVLTQLNAATTTAASDFFHSFTEKKVRVFQNTMSASTQHLHFLKTPWYHASQFELLGNLDENRQNLDKTGVSFPIDGMSGV